MARRPNYRADRMDRERKKAAKKLAKAQAQRDAVDARRGIYPAGEAGLEGEGADGADGGAEIGTDGGADGGAEDAGEPAKTE